MAKYVLTYRGGSGMGTTQAEIDKGMAEWGAWFASLGAAVVDGGNPFGASKSIGPAANAAQLGGYSVINAASLDDAVAKAKGCPILNGGGNVDVYEAIEM